MVTVLVNWDQEASVYYTDGGDVPGLNTESESFDGLVKRAIEVIPELIESHLGEIEIAFHLVSDRRVLVPT